MIVLTAMLTQSCGTSHNTWFSRHYQNMVTRFNVYFNGSQSYKEGMELLYKNGKDDYTKILPVYPISNHGDTSLVLSQMNRAIEKATKAERLHSIRKKPKKNSKRAKDPKYQQFMKKEEYNPMMSKVWLLHGKAQLHKGDFLGAVGTFTYITKHFTQEEKKTTEANIYLARCYKELDWTYDADDIIEKTGRKDIPKRLQPHYSAVLSDLKIDNKEYGDAIEPLKIAIETERDRRQKTRENFILAQLLHEQQKDEEAKGYYKKAYRHSRNYDMTFNSKVGYAIANYANESKAIRKLERMAKNERYADGLDKIYTAEGDIYIANDNKDKAIESYRKAIEASVYEGGDKINALVKLADLYYKGSEYIKAQPLYSEAASLMNADDDNYSRVSKRSQILGELAQQNNIVVTQDSVQRLAMMSESDRITAIKSHIKKLQDEEEAAKKKAAEDQKKMEEMASNMRNNSVPQQSGNKPNWYFYNNQLVATGKAEFQRRWGVRTLEDDWRRTNKVAVSGGFEDEGESVQNYDDEEELMEENEREIASNVNTNVDYYLKQLPQTPQQIEKSNVQIADALFAMGGIYEDKLEDIPMAIKTFEELERRFPRDSRIPDAYFMMYQMNSQKGDESTANWYRTQIVKKFPESSYAKVLKSPHYKENMKKMTEMQDSIYQQTYYAYTRNNFDSVTTAYKMMKETYPLSPLMPRMLFVDALAKGKSGNNEAFAREMEELVNEYPESDVSAMAKSMLSLYNSGRRVQYGSTHGSILALRDSLVETGGEKQDTMQFALDRQDAYSVMLVSDNKVDQNVMLFDVASYNFSGFIVRDFDVMKEKYEDKSNVMRISKLDGMNEAFWYIANLEQDSTMKKYIGTDSCYAIVISDYNLKLIRDGRSMEDYMTYYNDSILPLREAEHIDMASAEAQRRSLVDAALAAEKMAKEADDKAQQEKLEQELREAEEELARQEEEVRKSREERERRLRQKNETNVQSANSQKEQETKGSDNATSSNGTQKPDQLKKTEESRQEQPSATNVIKTTNQNGRFEEDLLSTHEYAIMIKGENADIDRVKSLIERYNSLHYAGMPLKVNVYRFTGKAVVTVESFGNAYEAKNYMFGTLRERQIFAPLSHVEYRNAIISTSNKDELIRTGDIDGYITFNREHYLRQ